MKKKTVFLILMVVGVWATALAGPASAAGAVDHSPQALRAHGLGAAFSADILAPDFAQADDCLTDPADDVVALTDQQASVNEPRADIVSFCPSVGSSGVTLQVSVDAPTDPEVDRNWQGSSLTWLLDTDADGEADFAAQFFIRDDAPVANVQNLREIEITCTADYSYEDGTITLAFPTSCIDGPGSLSVAPGIVYDQAVTTPGGRAVIDVAPNSGFSPADFDTIRIEGPTRIETAVAASRRYADGSSDDLVLARSDEFADAQAGAPLAIANDAPMLLTPTNDLHPATQVELERVVGDGGTVYILGGELAIGPEVADAITALGYTVVRYGGENRFETAVTIATEGLGSPNNVLLADGGGFEASILAGAASATFAEPAAVLLTDGDTLPIETATYLGTSPDANVVAIGADAGAAYPTADQTITADGDASALSVAVAEALYDDPTRVGLATSADFADALVAGPYLADFGPAPLLFVERDSLPDSVRVYIESTDSIVTIVIFGGVNAISDGVGFAAEDAVDAGPSGEGQAEPTGEGQG